jgi:hypothetical protein
MDFLVKTSPFVDWKRRIVTCYVGTTKYNLPTCKINDIDSICDDNTFAGLYVDDDIDSSENKLSRVTSDTKIVSTQQQYMVAKNRPRALKTALYLFRNVF